MFCVWQVADILSTWIEDTPLKTPSDYASVYAKVDRLSTSYCDEYEVKVLQKVMQWEACISSELKNEIVEGRKACNNLEHYERKVASLRGQFSRLANKNTEAAQNLYARLQRNESKLEEATGKLKECNNRLQRCDELIDYAWMSLYPLLAQLFQADVVDSKERAMAISSLRETLSEMSSCIQQKGLDLASPDSEEVWRYLSAKGPLNLAVREEKNNLASSLQRSMFSSASSSSSTTKRSPTKEVTTVSYRMNPDGTKTKIVKTTIVRAAADSPMEHVATSSQQPVSSTMTPLPIDGLVDHDPSISAEERKKQEGAIARHNR